ncbi:hypothetical protein AAG570_009423 [Ranatra chinensis]|uniref:Cilia- and flagella-associated protein 58 central coiled coil domain-containing protein n=1 Tax=Ranatra chinensis TaxID=642074 RepID=A0ABD0YZX0_9HEMI
MAISRNRFRPMNLDQETKYHGSIGRGEAEDEAYQSPNRTAQRRSDRKGVNSQKFGSRFSATFNSIPLLALKISVNVCSGEPGYWTLSESREVFFKPKQLMPSGILRPVAASYYEEGISKRYAKYIDAAGDFDEKYYTYLRKIQVMVRKVNSEKDALSIELKRVKEALKMSRLTVEKMDEKEAKLEETIEKSEKENVALQKEIDRLVTNNGLLATQLDRRSTELSLMYDKIDVMQAVLGRGEEQYNQRLDDIKILKLEIKKIRNEKELLKRSFTNMADLRKEIYHLNRDLLNERQKCQTLEEEMQSPINFHRWRMLEGTDPEKKELIDKAQALQKRVTKLVDQDAENKFQIKNLTELYNSAVSGLKKMPGLEAKNEQEKARHLIKDKDTQLKVLASEMKVCEEQLEQYKVEVKNLKKEMNEVKKKYFALTHAMNFQLRSMLKRNAATRPSIDTPSESNGSYHKFSLLPPSAEYGPSVPLYVRLVDYKSLKQRKIPDALIKIIKLKEDKRKQKEAEDNCEKRRNEEQSKLEKLAMGGGFSLVLADKRARKSGLDAMLRPKSR